MRKIWLTGDAVVDLIPDTETKYLKCPGGAPANVAVAIARLGGDAAFFGRVGEDPFGRFMKQTLAKEGIDTENMFLDKNHRTSTVIVDLDENGERSFTFMVKPSADQFMQIEDLPRFNKGEWLHVCSIALANEPSRSSTFEAMKRIKDAGGFVSFDPNIREEVWRYPNEMKNVINQAVSLADVVKFSDEELLFLTNSVSIKEGLSVLSSFLNKLVIITRGEKGALVVFENIQYLFSGKPVAPIDTTGAGDAFVGGLLAKLAQSDDWENIRNIELSVKWANGCGALATTQKGAMTSLPTQKQLVEYISNSDS